MRRRRGVLTVLAVGFLSLLAAGLAGSAVAGGPTSVLLVVPEEGRTASLYTGSPDYDELARLVGAYSAGGGSTRLPEGASTNGPAGASTDSDTGVTVTWLVHDTSIWRVDRVFLNSRSGPWISTQTTMNGEDLWSRPATWQRVKDGKALIALLDRLGVGSTPGTGTAIQQQTRSSLTGSSSTGSNPAGTGSGSTSGSDRSKAAVTGWIFGPVGVLLGIALTLGTLISRGTVKWPLGEPAAPPPSSSNIEVDLDRA